MVAIRNGGTSRNVATTRPDPADGQPVTTEDFRYAYENVMLNEDLNPGGLPTELMPEGKPPKFTIVDDVTVKFEFQGPNPNFLPALASPLPPAILLPAHYLKQFHKKFQTKEKLEELVKAGKYKNWRQMHIRLGRQNRPENPELPTLDPWVNTTQPPAEQFVFVRNPYFHRVDTAGQQLPYVDQFVLNTSSTQLIAAKTGAGESDLQSRYIEFEDYTFLKEAEKRENIDVLLWERTQGSRVALFPNLNYQDPVWRKIFHDVRFRRALSLAINRHEINMAVFFGLGRESADTILPQSPLFQESMPRHGPSSIRRQPTACSTRWGSTSATPRVTGSCRTAGWRSSWSRAPAKTVASSMSSSWCATTGRRSASSSFRARRSATCSGRGRLPAR